MHPQRQLEMLVDSLQLVASDADAQRSALPDFASPTDEVATTFGDAYLLTPQLARAGLLSQAAHESVRRLDEWFDRMPTDGSVDAPAPLATHPFWIQARKLAQDALALLGVPARSPQQRHVSWVEGARRG